jgi:hypothetical protein
VQQGCLLVSAKGRRGCVLIFVVLLYFVFALCRVGIVVNDNNNNIFGDGNNLREAKAKQLYIYNV